MTTPIVREITPSSRLLRGLWLLFFVAYCVFLAGPARSQPPKRPTQSTALGSAQTVSPLLVKLALEDLETKMSQEPRTANKELQALREFYGGKDIKYRNADVRLLIDAQNRQREQLERNNVIESVVARGLRRTKDDIAAEIEEHGVWGKVIGGLVKEAGDQAIDAAFRRLGTERDLRLVDHLQTQVSRLPEYRTVMDRQALRGFLSGRKEALVGSDLLKGLRASGASQAEINFTVDMMFDRLAMIARMKAPRPTTWPPS